MMIWVVTQDDLALAAFRSHADAKSFAEKHGNDPEDKWAFHYVEFHEAQFQALGEEQIMQITDICENGT
jgi:hypothetical protein